MFYNKDIIHIYIYYLFIIIICNIISLYILINIIYK